jgi:DNA-binding transcriptional LysR family regulator
VSLTEAGEQLLPHAVAALEALDAGVALLESARGAERARLRVGLSATAMVPVVSETMRLLNERYPDVELTVANAGLNQPAAGLKEGVVDVAFVRPPFLAEGLSMVTVLTEERYAVLPKNHPLAAREYVRPEDLVDEPWIWVEGADPEARAFWSLADFRGDKPLRTGTRINSFEEARRGRRRVGDHLPSGVRGTGGRDWFPAAAVRARARGADRSGRCGVAHGA